MEDFKFNMHPKQREFMEDDNPRVLYMGGHPARAQYNWVIKRFLEQRDRLIDSIKKTVEENEDPIYKRLNK